MSTEQCHSLCVHRTVPQSMCLQDSATVHVSTGQCQLSIYPINSATVHMSTESVHCPFIDRTVPLSICSHKVSTVHVSKEQCPQYMCPQNSVHFSCVQITVSIVHISIEQFQLSIYPHKSALCPCVNRTVLHPMCPQNSNTFNVSIKQCHLSIF